MGDYLNKKKRKKLNPKHNPNINSRALLVGDHFFTLVTLMRESGVTLWGEI